MRRSSSELERVRRSCGSAIDFRKGDKIDEPAFKQLIRAAVAANAAARVHRAAKET